MYLPAAGNYILRVFGDGTTRLAVDDQTTIDQSLTGQGWREPVRYVTTTGPAWHRIRLDYLHDSGNARLELHWSGPGVTPGAVPGSALTPRYDLVTTTVDADGHSTWISHGNSGYGITSAQAVVPAHGLETASTVDAGAGHLNLITYTNHEAPSASSYLRRTARQLPKGHSIQDTYYATGEAPLANNCAGTGDATSQRGRLKTTGGTDAPTTISYVYDSSGRVVGTKKTGDANWTCTSYDLRGRVTQVVDSAAVVAVTNTYTSGNTSSTIRDSAGASRTTLDETDLLGRSWRYTDEQGAVSRSVYDQAGRLADTYRTLPGGSEAHVEHFTYDDAGRRLTRTEYVSNPGGTGTIFTYDPAGRPEGTVRGTSPTWAVSVNTYDANHGWVTDVKHSLGSATLAESAYFRTLAGKVNGEIATLNGTLTKWVAYSFDQAGRLTDAGSHAYRYDANTNRCDTSTSACDGTTTGAYRYNNADQLTQSPLGSAYSYDTHGNLTGYSPAAGGTVTISYDRFDHATGVTTTGTGASTVTETLAPDGRVLRRTVTGANAEDTDFGYDDGGDSPAWSRPHAGGTVTTYLDGVIVTGTTPAWELANDHGDIVGTLDAAGTLTPYPVADEFGVAAATPTRLGWLSTKERFTIAPTLGLIRMGVRLYDPNLGRFLEPDPIEGGSANNYDYAEADPINGLDLGGLASCGRRGQSPRKVCAKGRVKTGRGHASWKLYNGRKGSHGYGYLHIKEGGHFNDFKESPGWETMKWAIGQVLKKPGRVDYRSDTGTYTYQAPVWMVNGDTGQIVKYTLFVAVNDRWSVITAYARRRG